MITKSKVKSQKSKVNLNIIFVSFVIWILSFVINPVYAKDKDLVLIYTGETHGALYPCNCPAEPDGGVARRATLIKQLKKEYPDSLVLDAGNFFSAGLLDQNSQNTPLDMQRASINLAAMELMPYDALTIGDDEFNFGKDFLSENLGKVKLNFVSCNLKFAKVSPYIIKEVAGIKVGIIGLTNPAVKRKAGDLGLTEPGQAVARAAQELKKQGAGLIILLSNLGEGEDLRLAASVPEIAVIIDGHGHNREKSKEAFTRSGDTVFLRAGWQGRKLGKAVLGLKAGKIDKVKVEEIRLSDKISDDADVLKILPRCFADSDCKNDGLIGACQNPGDANAGCLFSEAAKVPLTVITSKECAACNTAPAIGLLKRQFPGLVVTYLYYPDQKAAVLLDELKVTALPVYLVGKEAAREKNFDGLRNILEEKNDFYILKPQAGGLGYFLKRKKIKGKLDLFISPFDENTPGVLNVVREFDPQVHFLVVTEGDRISAASGNAEVEEDLRSVCVQKYYPQRFWDYITCRAKDIHSAWWDDCAVNMDTAKIKSCSRGPEGRALLKENTDLSRELKVMFGPSYLVENNQIFSSQGTPSKEELKKIIKR